MRFPVDKWVDFRWLEESVLCLTMSRRLLWDTRSLCNYGSWKSF